MDRVAPRLARVVERWPTLPSTNDRAMTLAKEGAAEGVAVVAARQTEGRGQRGRTWHSPAGAGLYVSFVVRPTLRPDQAPLLTVLAGLAAHAALNGFCSVRLGLKWPNDVLVAEPEAYGRKLAGILVEASTDTERLLHAVVGIGVNLRAVERPVGIARRAVSLEELGGMPEADAVLYALAERLETELAAGVEGLPDRFEEAAMGLGEEVEIGGATPYTGRLVGLAEDGALRLSTPTGEHRIRHGDLLLPGVPR